MKCSAARSGSPLAAALAYLLIAASWSSVSSSQTNSTAGNPPNQSRLPGTHVPEEVSPVRRVEVVASDGVVTEVAVRMPPGRGPFSAVVLLRGGMSNRPIDSLVSQSQRGALSTRLLAAGYGIVVGTYRTYAEKSRDQGPIEDCLAIIGKLKQLPEVDSQSIVAFGHSGGGRLVLELSGLRTRAGLAAIAAGEPATTLYAEMYPKGMRGPNMEVSRNLEKYFTAENKRILERKVETLSTPVLIVHSDRHHVNILNNLHLVPTIREAGKDLETILYPGFGHGFVWGGAGVTEEAFAKLVDDLNRFFSGHVRAKPKRLTL